MDERLVPILGMVGLFVLVVVVAVVLRVIRSRRPVVPRAEDLERDAHIEKGIERGELARDPISGVVFPTCVVCGSRATDAAPISGVSWMDNLPLLNRLHSLAPRYIIVDRDEGTSELCKIHKKVAEKKLEQFHAGLRAERAEFNAMQEDKVAQMDSGALRQLLMDQHQSTLPVLTVPSDMPKQLPAPQVVTTVVTSSSRVGQ